MEINAKKVIVTGASSGIGREVVRLLLEQDCTVLGVSRNIEKIGITHPRLILKKCDVSVQAEVDELFTFAKAEFGGIDLFIANAGFAYFELLEKPDWPHIQSIFDTNVVSMMYCAEKMKQMQGSRAYNFVSVASAMSFLSLPGYALYSGTKAAVRGFGDAYQYELAAGQFFQVVYPIATRTNFFKVAGDSPVPWPSQSVEIVAQSILKGIRRNAKAIHPSVLFQLMMLLIRLFPFVGPIYASIENRKFQIWVSNRASVEQSYG